MRILQQQTLAVGEKIALWWGLEPSGCHEQQKSLKNKNMGMNL